MEGDGIDLRLHWVSRGEESSLEMRTRCGDSILVELRDKKGSELKILDLDEAASLGRWLLFAVEASREIEDFYKSRDETSE